VADIFTQGLFPLQVSPRNRLERPMTELFDMDATAARMPTCSANSGLTQEGVPKTLIYEMSVVPEALTAFTGSGYLKSRDPDQKL
jgi:hypothetical protein